MGLLDTLMGDTPERQAQFGLLMQGLAQKNGVGGLLAANQYAGQAPDRRRQAEMEAMKMQLLQAQIGETQAQMQERQAQADAKKAAMEQSARMRAGIPGLFSSPGMTGGEPVPQEMGGVPMFGQPMGAAPMRQTPGGFDVQKAIQLGMDPKMIQEYAALQNMGKPKVARTVEVMRNGKPTLIQLGEDGQEIGAGFDQWKAPVFQSLGGRTAAIDPVSMGERGSFAQSQSPDSLASNALTRRGQDITLRGQNLTDARSREGNNAGKIPPGYRMKMDGNLEAIPGGPADIKAGELGAKREAQQQGAVAQADRIIGKVDQALSKVGVTSAGIGGSMMASVPGSDARNLRADLDTIKANLGFAELQAMRQSSPTGGALGAIAVQELTALQSTVASLDQAQSAGQLKARLDEVKKHYSNWKQAVSGASTPSTGGATGGWGIKKVN